MTRTKIWDSYDPIALTRPKPSEAASDVVDLAYAAVRRHSRRDHLPRWLKSDVTVATRTLLQHGTRAPSR